MPKSPNECVLVQINHFDIQTFGHDLARLLLSNLSLNISDLEESDNGNLTLVSSGKGHGKAVSVSERKII